MPTVPALVTLVNLLAKNIQANNGRNPLSRSYKRDVRATTGGALGLVLFSDSSGVLISESLIHGLLAEEGVRLYKRHKNVFSPFLLLGRSI